MYILIHNAVTVRLYSAKW